MAVANYHDRFGHYPPLHLTDAGGRPAHSWRVLLLPYLGCEALYEQYNFSEPWDGPNNRRLAGQMPSVYAFHGQYEPGQVTTNYLAVAGPETLWPGPTPLSSKQVNDGISSTVLLVENLGANVHWMEPRDLSFAEMSFEINSPNGVSSPYTDPAVLMLDGMLYRLYEGLQPKALRAMFTVNGGEKARDDGSGWAFLPDGRRRDLADR